MSMLPCGPYYNGSKLTTAFIGIIFQIFTVSPFNGISQKITLFRDGGIGANRVCAHLMRNFFGTKEDKNVLEWCLALRYAVIISTLILILFW